MRARAAVTLDTPGRTPDAAQKLNRIQTVTNGWWQFDSYYQHIGYFGGHARKARAVRGDEQKGIIFRNAEIVLLRVIRHDESNFFYCVTLWLFSWREFPRNLQLSN